MTSRFLRKSTRRQIRDFDNFQNAYPNLRRSSDQTNLTFDNQSPFNDTRTIRFGTSGVSFPSMTPPGYNNLPSSSISLSSLTKIRASSQEFLPDLPGVEQSAPFDETRLNIPGNEDYIATSSVYRLGFKSATRNKIAIPIDISSNETKTLFKLSQYDTALDPAGPLYGSGSTGFVYYNFKEKRWEDIGLTDQYRGHMGKIIGGLRKYVSSNDVTGSEYFMEQFLTSQNSIRGATVTTPASLVNGGYDRIGTPTNFFDAPNAARYHATSSQCLKLSQYIAQPFILEEIDVSITVEGKRTFGALTGSAIPQRAAGSLRDIDTMNFFVYRQTGNSNLNSKRNLITYASIAFYNRDLFFPNVVKESVVQLHEPVAAFEYGLQSTIPFTSSTIQKTVNFKIRPKNTVQQQGISLLAGGTSKYTLSGSNDQTYFTNLVGGNAWNGSDITPYLSNESPMKLWNLGSPFANPYNDEFYILRSYESIGLANTPIVTAKALNPDPRFIYKTFVEKPETIDLVAALPFIKPGESPYILYPDDNLIFGFDTLVGPVWAQSSASPYLPNADTSFLSISGSIYKILPGNAKITLYGSLIQDGQEKLFNNLNQNLISPAVHELVFDPAEDSDQFLINERYTYTGSYLDNFMSSGSILKGTRFVSASLTAENTPIGGRGSFERFVSFNNTDEIYYDCLAVDGRTLDSEDSAFSYVPVSDKFTPVLGAGGNNLFQTDGNLRPNFPYRSGKIRIISTPTLSISSTNYTGKDFKTAFFYTGKNQYSNFPYDIRPFFSSSSPGSNYVAYGMLNVENQQPKNVFRPDRYGQMRDMLEQPFDGITYKLTGKVGPTTQPVQILFVSASSEVVVDPALTNSNNLSEHATSSLPYFDGLNLSRSTPFPTSSLGPFVPTSIVFQT